MFDVAIIGGGPAGLSAALTIKNLNKSLIWLASSAFNKVGRAESVTNYPGLYPCTGEELSLAFSAHAKNAGLNITQKLVTGVYDMDGYFSVLAGNENFEARAVILCLGVQTVKPAKGEEEFLGRGISYCATCDGMLYKGKNLVVVPYDKHFEPEVEFLCKIAGTCCVLPMYKGFKTDFSNAKTIVSAPVEYRGDLRLKEVVLSDGRVIPADGAFVLKQSVSPSTLVHGLISKNGQIEVDRAMRTNIKGVFAAGDCTGRPYQYAKAVGEGNIAAHSAAEYLFSDGGKK